MTADDLFDAITAHRAALIDQLEPLNDQQWNTASLCEGWAVRHVVGHLVSIQDVPTWRFIVGAVGMSGFHRKVDRFAREFGARDKSELLDRFRELVPNRKAPPLIGPMAPMMDLMVHSLDIGKPLGLPALYAPDAAKAVLDAMYHGFPVMASKSRTKGLRFEADDLDWAAGSGPLIRGSGGDLALAITGRLGALVDLQGDGVPALRSRL
jgi:uncharacterized protein (TIGR03083 family)